MRIYPLWLRRALGEIIGAVWLPFAMLIDGCFGFADGVALAWADYRRYRAALGYGRKTSGDSV